VGEIRALTVRQPIAYLAGVLAGDGYLSRPSAGERHGILGLHVADEAFARAFADAIGAAYGVEVPVVRESDGYWRARKYSGGGRFDELPAFLAQHDEQRAAWLRGFFDAEGNANLTPKPARGPSSWDRRVAFYNTDLAILDTALSYLTALRIPGRIRPARSSAGHLGRKQVYELLVIPCRPSFEQFARLIGSSIPRKQAVLDAIPASYSDRRTARRQAQAAGAATKRARAIEERLPRLLTMVAEHIAADRKPTYAALSRMDGFWSARKTLGLTRDQIVELALRLETGAT
jgi:LAGLIDADG-like domain